MTSVREWEGFLPDLELPPAPLPLSFFPPWFTALIIKSNSAKNHIFFGLIIYLFVAKIYLLWLCRKQCTVLAYHLLRKINCKTIKDAYKRESCYVDVKIWIKQHTVLANKASSVWLSNIHDHIWILPNFNFFAVIIKSANICL